MTAYAEPVMGMGRRFHGVDGNANAAVGTIFETGRHRQTADHFTVNLGLGGAGTDGGPTNEVAKVIHGERAQGFRGQWQAHI